MPVRLFRIGSALLLVLIAPKGVCAAPALNLSLKCSPDNDLYQVLRSSGIDARRYDSSAEAIRDAPRGSGVLILADGYPAATESVRRDLFQLADEKQLRIYLEYPAAAPGIQPDAPHTAGWERAVIASGAFGPELGKLRLLAIHDCRFVPVSARSADIVLARVAGFNTAVYGLPDHDVFPLLFEHRRGRLMIATTKLSNFVTARYAPADAWSSVWKRILAWAANVKTVPPLRWVPAVRPSYSRTEPLPRDVEPRALERAADWYRRSRMLVGRSWVARMANAARYPDRVAPAPPLAFTAGDGADGLLEGFASAIHVDGSQSVRWWLRADCMAEASFALALAARELNRAEHATTSRNLNDFVYFRSVLQQGSRAQPDSASFGLLGWNTTPKYSGDLDGFDVYYGDDNARAMLGTLGAEAVLRTARWDDSIARCVLANFRTTGRDGFRGKRIDQPQLEAQGWRYYFDRRLIHYAPHYEAYLWAVYLWAYARTGYQPFLDRTLNAIRMTMYAYPNDWRWTNGLQQERARMLLPLAWLVRVADSPEHRAWLARIASDLLRDQDASGAIREEIGPTGKGDYGAPKSNEEYGTAEAPLIQQNGDPLTDLLYTAEFAFFGLHEAAAATGEPTYRDAEDKLAAFLCRIQIQSEHLELDGAWFRGFDYRRWEYWASNADAGWGAWSIESGWTQAWVASVLGMRRMRTCFWDLTNEILFAEPFKRLLGSMLPRPEPRRAPERQGFKALSR